VFSVNIFRADQRREAGRLARPAARAPHKLEEMQYRDGVTGAPVLPETLGYLECRVVAEQAAGDHTIFVGEVVDAGAFREGEPLEIHAAGFTYGG
jgi:flavin reductase (DIM6/NTAB) family NADH-FMN oxidoreductase RutF